MDDINPEIRAQLTSHYKMFSLRRGVKDKELLRCNICKQYKPDTIKYKYRGESTRLYNICPECANRENKYELR